MTTATFQSDDLPSRVAALERKLASLEEELEYARTVAGMKRSLADADRGLGIPLKQADKHLRTKYKIPKS